MHSKLSLSHSLNGIIIMNIEINNVKPKANESVYELKNTILTRVQGKNSWKQKCFNDKKMPKFIQNALNEFDAFVK